MDRGAWWATVHGVKKSQTRLSDFLLGVSQAIPHPTLPATYSGADVAPVSQVRMLGRADLAQCHTQSPQVELP